MDLKEIVVRSLMKQREDIQKRICEMNYNDSSAPSMELSLRTEVNQIDFKLTEIMTSS